MLQIRWESDNVFTCRVDMFKKETPFTQIDTNIIPLKYVYTKFAR